MMPCVSHDTFTTAELAEFAAEHGMDVPLLISSHGETFGVGGFSWEPDEKVIYLVGMCPFDNPIAAVSFDGDPDATARGRHFLAERLAAHMEEVAAKIRAKYPKPASGP